MAVDDSTSGLLWRAVALHQQGKAADAERLYREILTREPQHFDALHLLGVLEAQRRNFQAAVVLIEQALRVRPNDPSANANLGTALRDLGRPEEALTRLDHALRLAPRHVEALSSRGDVLRDTGLLAEALDCYDLALAVNPDHVGTLNNKGVALASLGHQHEALACYDRLLRLRPDHAEGHWNASLAHLLVGDLRSGLKEYEWRWQSPWLKDAWRDFGRPLWLGAESLRGKSILLWAEQGLGDTIQFSRLVNRVAALGARTVLIVQPRLKELMASLDGVDTLLAYGEPVPDTDFQCPLLSLPLALGINLESLRVQQEYLHCDPLLFAKWGALLGRRERPRIGLVWSGNPSQAYDRRRSVPLEQMLRIAEGPFEFVCLHKDITELDRALLAERPDIRVFSDEQAGFHDAAALVQHMDLVITVDTAVAHLAGALGVTTWVLLPFVPDWRWLLDRSDSPWYQSARLFRQASLGDSSGVIDDVRRGLGALGQGLDRAVALHRQGKLADAAALYRNILVTKPDHFDALHLLGVVEAQRANRGLAERFIGQALTLRPDDVSANANMGAALRDSQKPAMALEHLDRALRIDPRHRDAWYNRGNALVDLERSAEALANYDRALALDPDHVEALVARSRTLLTLGKNAEALTGCDRALAIRPNHAEALNTKGNILRTMGRPDDALAAYDLVLMHHPTNVAALINRGLASWALQQPGAALACYDRVLAIEPDHFEALCNRARMLRELKRLDEAIETVDRILCIRPDSTEFHFSAATYRLLNGDFRNGWREYEWRWQFAHLKGTRPDFGRRDWIGQESLAGKSIVLLDEQGFGDTIQFCRFAKTLSDRDAKIVLRVQPQLRSLMVGLDGVETVVTHGDAVPDTNFQCPLMSLPLALGINATNIPAQIPYLQTDHARIAKWTGILGPKQRKRIGLVWAGNPFHLTDRKRSIPLEQFIQLADGPFEYICLQKEIRPPHQTVIKTFCDRLTDFHDTAALIQHLDLVITVETAVAHLAAALGCPTWILLPFVPDWRWLLDRTDSPWYPTARLFRQPSKGEWQSVIGQVRDELLRSAADPC